VQAIAYHFADHGYMTDFRELREGRFFLYHQNCAIYNLATKYRQLCFMELKLIEALSGAKVTRQQYIFKNQPICGYLIVPYLDQ
jgi:predicted ArsR family transcriptional regulator